MSGGFPKIPASPLGAHAGQNLRKASLLAGTSPISEHAQQKSIFSCPVFDQFHFENISNQNSISREDGNNNVSWEFVPCS
jgi:hypothetical protein